MNVSMKTFFAVGVLAALSGCAIKQDVRPVVGMQAGQEVCVVQNPAVRDTFLSELEGSLQRRGFQTKRVEPNSDLAVCPLTVIYTARWSWDLAMYMSFAELKVFREGRLEGSARYDSTGGGGNFGKFISAEKKVNELVGELFPGR
jgi:hypothetical protein